MAESANALAITSRFGAVEIDSLSSLQISRFSEILQNFGQTLLQRASLATDKPSAAGADGAALLPI